MEQGPQGHLVTPDHQDPVGHLGLQEVLGLLVHSVHQDHQEI